MPARNAIRWKRDVDKALLQANASRTSNAAFQQLRVFGVMNSY